MDNEMRQRLLSVATYWQNIVVACLIFAFTFANAQELEQTIFGATENSRDAAEAAQAVLLSPNAYQRGVEELDAAKRDFEKGKNLERIEDGLAEARSYFQAAIANADIARLTLRDAIESRIAANEAEAYRLAPRDWAQAEKQFNDAATALEKGNLDPARERGDQANDMYRSAELNAIRARHLSQARGLIAEADQQKVEKSAPLTLNQARELLQQADASLVQDRYQTDEAVALASQASYEARHAMYVAVIVQRVHEDETSVEGVVRDWELPVTAIAESLDIKPDFSTGYADTSGRIIESIREIQGLREDLVERDRQIRGLEEELRELDDRLGGATAERTTLVRRLERQARTREQFELVETMFDPSEAIVLRDVNNLIIRLTGLSFATNSSQLDAAAIGLINRLKAAIDVFPQCDLIIEGHTDSQGNADRNLQLSRARAQSVMDYITNEMRIPDYRITAVGYGDARPISNNKTTEDRAKNRRIDLIIVPKPESL
jgi:OOP family OmpA-OmpF porin